TRRIPPGIAHEEQLVRVVAHADAGWWRRTGRQSHDLAAVAEDGMAQPDGRNCDPRRDRGERVRGWTKGAGRQPSAWRVCAVVLGKQLVCVAEVGQDRDPEG